MNQEELKNVLDSHLVCITNSATAISGLVALYDSLLARVNQLEAELSVAKLRDEEFAAQLRGQK